MALRILHNELFSHHVGVMQRLLSSERVLSSAARTAAALDTSNPDGGEASNKKTAQPKIVASFRTQESNPTKHKESHLSRYYTVPGDISKTLFQYGGLPKAYEKLCHIFTETAIMVRKPYLEVTNCIESVDFSKPAVRIVLYGKPGHGKSMTLAHVVHYGYSAGFMLVHVPWVNTFMRRCKDASPSESKPGMMDVPIDAAAWLVQFRTQNQHLLKTLNLKTSKPYQYGPRDIIEQGEPIDALIEFGIGRAKYACDVVEALLREIKGFSNSGLVKTMVVIDGFNGLFAPNLKTQRRKILEAKCTLALPFLEITQFDWCNGVVILSVDQLAHHDMFKAESNLPLYLLGKEGWEHIDPFIPIMVDKYDTAEMNSSLDFYIDRRWIQHPGGQTEAGRAELRSLCAGNGFELMNLCAPL
ncbi:28S ribosomal protein S29, mitochondrial [Thrips palmi]|uniref:Small ribosomal subunit protein mS29 n=1 Tax=Thrips palmi TaxID=161013 RepID=A0A6P8YQV9_THRPL|nr:28S ribosomal protein S29, mitochondrial [Thrips palmi]